MADIDRQDFTDFVFSEALEAGEQEGLPRQGRDLAKPDFRRKVPLGQLAAAIHREGIPDAW